jgi:flagellar hook-length control protein FliK
MEMPILINCIDTLKTDVKSLLTSQVAEFSGNVGENDDFMAILSKLINEKVNSKFTGEEIKGLISFSANIDDALAKMPFIEQAKLIEDIRHDAAGMIEAADYLVAAIVEALKSMENSDGLGVPFQGADGEKADLMRVDAEKVEINEEAVIIQSKDIKDLSNSEISKDIRQLIEKTFMELRSTTQAFSAKGEAATGTAEGAAISNGEPKESEGIHSNGRLTATIPQNKEINRLTDESQTSILRQDSTISSNKEVNNAMNAKNYQLGEKGTVAIIQTETSNHSPQEHSDQKELQYNSQNKNAAMNQNTPLSSGQGFSSYIKKAVLEGDVWQTQQSIRLSHPDIGTEKLVIINSNEKSLKLTIDTDGIGALDIELTLEKGVINAQIFASESSGKNFLDNNISAILNSLLREGLNIGKFSISLGYKRDDAKEEHGESAQKAENTLQELDRTVNSTKNHLISIFV